MLDTSSLAVIKKHFVQLHDKQMEKKKELLHHMEKQGRGEDRSGNEGLIFSQIK